MAAVDQERVVTIDISHLLTPAAILIAGMMVSGTLLFSMNGDGFLNRADSDVQGAATDTTGTTAPTGGDNPLNDPNISKSSAKIGDDPIKGDKDKAKVVIVEFTDYECPYCKRHYSETYGQIVSKYIDTGKVMLVTKDFPLSFHPNAKPAAVAANCVYDIAGAGKFYDFHDKLFAGTVLSRETYVQYASEVGVDAGRFAECIDKNDVSEVDADVAEGGVSGISGTPGFIIGKLKDDGTVEGYMVPGAYPFSTFETLIEDLL